MEAVVEDPRYEGLDEIDRAKVGNNVSRKTSEQQDCDFIRAKSLNSRDFINSRIFGQSQAFF